MVIVNDFEAIEKLFSKDELLCRSKEWRLYGLSVGYPMSLEGDEWVENRRFCIQALRDIGFAKPSIQNDILAHFLNTLAFPGRRNIEKHFRALGDFTRNEIYARKRTIKLPSSKTLIDAYLTKMAEQENDPESKMSALCALRFKFRAVENLMSTAIGFFQAGSAGVPTYLNWHMINFALRADTLQAQVQEEIDRVVGSLRPSHVGRQAQDAPHHGRRVGDAALEGNHST
ncbi:hypothetical protein MTO96_013721 [Rhipicephalus appendiculatus]